MESAITISKMAPLLFSANSIHHILFASLLGVILTVEIKIYEKYRQSGDSHPTKVQIVPLAWEPLGSTIPIKNGLNCTHPVNKHY